MNTDIENIQFTEDELYILKKTWDNLAEKNSGAGVSKEIFSHYVQLNGLLQELLYSKFDRKKNLLIDFEDFVCTMNVLCFGSNNDHARFLFDMCDINNDGKVERTLLTILLHSIPHEIICKSDESIDEYISNTFGNLSSIKCEDFKNWAFSVPKIMSYIKDHIPYNIENNLKRRQSLDKLDILPKITENLEYSSSLWKKCKKLGLLKKQYYYLRGSCLYYYNSQHDIKPQGIIYLVGSLIKSLDHTIGNLCCFEITQLDLCSNEHNVHENRILYCDSLETRNEWVENLQTASHMRLFEDKYYLYTGLKLGSGAFSTVYKCTKHENFDIQYAVKVIDKTKFGNIEKEHFRVEINILKMIDHPTIIKTYDIYETRETISIVTELVSDGELFDYINHRSCFNDDELRPLMSQLLSCALYLHEHGIIHSDIKPENILYIKSTGQIKLIDFGLSKILLPNKKIEYVDGTLSYVAPEALKSNIYYAQSDIWSIGVVMYLLVYGKLPFDPTISLENSTCTSNLNEIIIYNILNTEIFISSKKSKFANKLLKRLLQKNPLHRPSAKVALADDFFSTCQTVVASS